MDTKDLDSYHPGYDNYCEQNSKVSAEEYTKQQEKIEIYEKTIDGMKEALAENCSYEKKVQFIRAFIEEMETELSRC